MSQQSREERQAERVTDLMNRFWDYDKKWQEAIARGDSFLDCHEWQIHASEMIHAIDDECLLHVAKEMYPWEKEKIDDYLECWEEIQSGVKI